MGADHAKGAPGAHGVDLLPSAILEVHGERMTKRTFQIPGFRIELHQKELNLALSSARQVGVSCPIRDRSGSSQRLRGARRQGLGSFGSGACALNFWAEHENGAKSRSSDLRHPRAWLSSRSHRTSLADRVCDTLVGNQPHGARVRMPKRRLIAMIRL